MFTFSIYGIHRDRSQDDIVLSHTESLYRFQYWTLQIHFHYVDLRSGYYGTDLDPTGSLYNQGYVSLFTSSKSKDT